jgi:RNA polymerase sigma-70 factor (ECF subfamily)
MHAVTQRAQRGPNDVELLAKIAERDLSALGLLFDRHAGAVHGFVMRLGIPSGDADDLVQSTFLLVLQAAPKFRDLNGRGSARAWLLGLASNVVWRHRRSVGRAAARVGAWALLRSERRSISPAEAFEGNEAAVRAQRALWRLSPKHREAFVLVVLEGVPGEEAAAILNVPVATVWTRLHRARRELREDLLGKGS